MASIRLVVGWLGLFFISIGLECVQASSNGAPLSSCESMLPGHGSASSSQSPFDNILSQVSDYSQPLFLFNSNKINKVEFICDQEEMNSDDVLTLTLQANVSANKTFQGITIYCWNVWLECLNTLSTYQNNFNYFK